MGDDGGAALITVAWNITKDLATLMQNSASVEMPGRAFALPEGKEPHDLDWAGQRPKDLEYALTWGSTAQEWGVSTGTQLRVGASWKYGGQLDGSGKYLHDAYLWAILDHSGLGQDFEVKGNFGDAVMEGDTSVLTGDITVVQSYVTMHWQDFKFDVEIRGDGGGSIRRK